MNAQEISNLITQQLALANQELQASLDQRFANFAGEVDTMRAQLSGEIATLRTQIEGIVKTAEDRYSSNMDTIDKNAEGVRRDLDNVTTNVRRIENESVSISSKFTELQNITASHRTDLEKGIMTIKEGIDKKIEEIQNSLSTAVVSNSSDTMRSGGGSARTFSLDTDKRLLNYTSITGNEDIIMIHEWWTKLFVKMESCIPMSKAYLEAVVVSPTEVTNQEIDSRDDRMLGHRLNRELYSLLTGLTSSKAWSSIKNIDSRRGLEALRTLYKATTMRGPAQLQAEHRYLNNPTHKPQSAADVPQWIQEWEYRMDQLAVASSDYSIPNTQRRNVLYESLPSAIKVAVDAETGKGNLITYETLKAFVKSVGTTELLSKQKNPTPIALNMVDSPSTEPASPEWSKDEWMQWMQTDEGSEFARQNPDNEDVLQIIGSLTLQGKKIWRQREQRKRKSRKRFQRKMLDMRSNWTYFQRMSHER